MGSKLDAVRERIAKLLNMTEERGASPAEAATAFALAQRMMTAHALSESEVLAAFTDGEAEDEGMDWHPEHDVPQGGKGRSVRSWVGILAYRIGYNHGCATKWDRPQGLPVIRFYGRKQDADTAAYMLRLAMTEVDRMAKVWAARSGFAGARPIAYRYGCASAIVDSLREEYNRARATFSNSRSALVVLDRAKRAQEEADCHGGKARAPRASDAFLAGKRDGKGVSFNSSRGNLGGGARRLGSGK
jgi:hypothetical protein